MRKFFSKFIKSHKGSHAIEAIFIVPVWIMLLLYCGYVNLISTARQSLADETSAITNIIVMSNNEAEARRNVATYIRVNKLQNKFSLDGENGTQSFLIITDKNGAIVGDNNWHDKTEIYISVTINTAFTGINFNTITVFDYEIEVFTSHYTNKCLAVIRNGVD